MAVEGRSVDLNCVAFWRLPNQVVTSFSFGHGFCNQYISLRHCTLASVAKRLSLPQCCLRQWLCKLKHNRRAELMQPAEVLYSSGALHVESGLVAVCRCVDFLVHDMGRLVFVKATQAV